MEIFPGRNYFEKKALKFNSIYTDCYPYDSFYIVPVMLSYKLFEDKRRDCASDTFELHIINGSKVGFSRQRKAILPIKMDILIPDEKKQTSKEAIRKTSGNSKRH